MDNATRRQLLDKARSTGYPGSIVDVFSAYDQGKDLIGEFVQQQQQAAMQSPMQVAQTPEEQQQGLRPAHAAGNVDQVMIFPNVQPGQSFNTMGMKDNINIEKFNDQGNLVESYKDVPPGIVNLPTGPYEGTVIESRSRMKTGGAEKDPPTKKKVYTDPLKFEKAEEIYKDSLADYLKYKNIYESYPGALYRQTYDEIAELAEKNKRDYGWAKSDYPQKPQVKPVYKEKPKEIIIVETPKLETKPAELIIPQQISIPQKEWWKGRSTLEVLNEDVIPEDRRKQKPTVVNKPPDFKTGGVNKYQTAGPKNPPPANLPWINQQGQYTQAPPVQPKMVKLTKPLNQYTEGYKLPDPTWENIAEIFDPTGILSHDDAQRAYESWKKSGRQSPTLEEDLDMFSALPMLGKYSYIKYLDPNSVKTAYKAIPWQQVVNLFGTEGLFSPTNEEDEKAKKRETGGANIGGIPLPSLPQEEPTAQLKKEPIQSPEVQQHMQTSPMAMGSHLTPFMQRGENGELYYDPASQMQAPPEVKQYFKGGLKNRVRYNKAKYKR